MTTTLRKNHQVHPSPVRRPRAGRRFLGLWRVAGFSGQAGALKAQPRPEPKGTERDTSEHDAGEAPSGLAFRSDPGAEGARVSGERARERRRDAARAARRQGAKGRIELSAELEGVAVQPVVEGGELVWTPGLRRDGRDVGQRGRNLPGESPGPRRDRVSRPTADVHGSVRSSSRTSSPRSQRVRQQDHRSRSPIPCILAAATDSCRRFAGESLDRDDLATLTSREALELRRPLKTSSFKAARVGKRRRRQQLHGGGSA